MIPSEHLTLTNDAYHDNSPLSNDDANIQWKISPRSWWERVCTTYCSTEWKHSGWSYHSQQDKDPALFASGLISIVLDIYMSYFGYL